MATLTGARLTREQVCQRLDVHRNTLARYIAERNFPTPGQDGKWLLAEVIDWETRK
jgi:predicted DNA-binding transcriptional regulator AlpA